MFWKESTRNLLEEMHFEINTEGKGENNNKQ